LLFWPSRKVSSISEVLQIVLTSITADKQYSDSAEFRRFRRQLFHTSLAHILSTLRPGMTTPEVVWCADGHFRRAVYGLGPYIADYPEQVLIACIVQNWCPRYVQFVILGILANMIIPQMYGS
jgi:hypothetical protein